MNGQHHDTGGRDMSDFLPEPALRDTADRLRRVLCDAVPDADFRRRLREQLVDGRAESIAAGLPETAVMTTGMPEAVRVMGARRRPAVLAWAGAVAAAVAAGVAVVQSGAFPGGEPAPVGVAVLADVMGAASVDPAGSVTIRFSRPLDHARTEAALRVAPYADVDLAWQGNALRLTAAHGFAPNTPYVVTIDHRNARTATGAPIAADLHLVFGTAPVAAPGAGPAGAVPAMSRRRVAGAQADSEAVVAADGSLLLTGAQAGRTTGYRSGLVRITANGATRLSPTTDAICVSRSGNFIAYLSPAGTGTELVFADRTGNPLHRLDLPVDGGSPLGWIGDAEVSLVSGGQLTAVNSDGHVRTLSGTRLDAAHDRIDIAPGGRYAYLQPEGRQGQLVDLVTGATHPLPGATGDPAFSADGATVLWVDGSGAVPRLATAPSGGGPVTTVPVPVAAGDVIGDLSVAPGGAWFVYTVTRSDRPVQLRLAALPDGRTLAVSGGDGGSPNWAASGRLFTVLAGGGNDPHVDAVTVPDAVLDARASATAVAAMFADAQVGGDIEAQRALAMPGLDMPGHDMPGLDVPTVPRVTRASVLWVLLAKDGTATARIRLTADPRPDDPVATEVRETVTLAPSPGGPPVVRAVAADPPARPAPHGPTLTHLDTVPGVVRLTFDSDLDPAAATAAVTVSTMDGQNLDAGPTYDPATRTVTLRPGTPSVGPTVVTVGTGLRDLAGQHLAATQRITLP